MIKERKKTGAIESTMVRVLSSNGKSGRINTTSWKRKINDGNTIRHLHAAHYTADVTKELKR